jgi:hypothetical protein
MGPIDLLETLVSAINRTVQNNNPLTVTIAPNNLDRQRWLLEHEFLQGYLLAYISLCDLDEDASAVLP